MRARFIFVVVNLALAVSLAGSLYLRAQESSDLLADADTEEDATPRPRKVARKKPGHMGKDKGDIEKYLKHRIAILKTSHKSRLDFVAKDSKEWAEFWTKVKDERQLFEVRIARQRLDLFESLGSLDRKEHPTTISDFERLQGNQIKAFENSQKGKMSDFFAARDKRWKDYYASQEKDRAGFAAEVDASWDQLKATLKVKGGSSSR